MSSKQTVRPWIKWTGVVVILPVVALFVWALVTGAGEESDESSGVPLRLQVGCSDFILAGDDWQNDRTTDDAFHAEIARIFERVRTTDLGDEFGDVLAAINTGDPTLGDQLRSLGTACGAVLPD